MTTQTIRTMTLAEDASLTSGGTFWTTKEDGRGRRALLTDGPHGVRFQAGHADHLGIAASEPATCFPPAAGLAQSWNPELVARVGAALAVEARHYGVGVLLGPGINIRRDPRGGRNFEYFSEDPYLSGALGVSWVRGLQSGGVGASLKHFAANNCETDRMRSSSEVAPRALREIYLRAFERVVREAAPWTVMCSYNKINGVLASQNSWLLTDVLRREWGFEGAVVSDWGAVADRVAAVAAGLDLAMPGGDTSAADQEIVDAVNAGRIDGAQVSGAADRVEALIDKVARGAEVPVAGFDVDIHHELAREAAAQSIVLLKNDEAVLPLARTERVAAIGPFAKTPRFQGGGSSHVNAAKTDIPVEELLRRSPNVTYAPGIVEGVDPSTTIAAAVDTAAGSDVAILFLGLTDREESEGADREHIQLPSEHLDLLRAVVKVQPRTVVVLSHGGVVDVTEVARLSPAVLDGALLGQAGGSAIADVLFGDVNPSGKLTETVPLRLQDAPSYLNFPGEHSRVTYGEGVFVGYRGYDARDIPVAFPFGHGLSYTTFEYGAVSAEPDETGIDVAVPVTNSGIARGREVVQFYVGKADSAVQRAPRELKAFASVTVDPGETIVATARIRREDLAYWDDRINRWIVEDGAYTVWTASSSRDLRSKTTLTIAGDHVIVPLTFSSTLGEVFAHPVAGPALQQAMMTKFADSDLEIPDTGSDTAGVADAIPLDHLASMSGGGMAVDLGQLAALLEHANAASASAQVEKAQLSDEAGKSPDMRAEVPI